MKKSKTEHTEQELRSIYLHAFKDQLNALRHSARWKVGNRLIRFIEQLMGRKKSVLAIDQMDQLLEALLKHGGVDKNYSSSNSRIHSPTSLGQPTHKIKSCAFAVSNSDPTQAIEGDVFTALELAEACKNNLGWHVSLIDTNDTQVINSDLLISLLFEFDIRPINDNVKKIAWIRSYAEHWLMKPWFDDYEIILCSSKKILDFIRLATDKPAFLFPIATNPGRITAGTFNEKLASDYSFSGSRWTEERNIEAWLEPDSIPYTFKLFGKNWENHPRLSNYSVGQVAYDRIPDIYASTKLIIDDANKSTLKWESVNSRVFDALGLGLPIITNNSNGTDNVFKESVPSYSSKEELNDKIQSMLKSPDKSIDLFHKLKQDVLVNHTYTNRAHSLNGILESVHGKKLSIAIKISANDVATLESWGDYHFAKSLSKALQSWGHSVRIDLKNDWYKDQSNVDVNIALKGLDNFTPNSDQTNILWIISHPNEVDSNQLNNFDHIFVASASYSDTLKTKTDQPVSTLLQCTDTDLFYPDKNDLFPTYDRLYVANSRRVKRTAIEFAISSEIALDVVGKDWDGIIPKGWIKGEYIPNHLLRYYYSNASTVIGDHWPDMLKNGFISNRIFDVLACGGNLISDNIQGLDDKLYKVIKKYNSSNEFKGLLESTIPPFSSRDMSEYIARHHSFDQRAIEILDAIHACRTV